MVVEPVMVESTVAEVAKGSAAMEAVAVVETAMVRTAVDAPMKPPGLCRAGLECNDDADSNQDRHRHAQ